MRASWLWKICLSYKFKIKITNKKCTHNFTTDFFFSSSSSSFYWRRGGERMGIVCVSWIKNKNRLISAQNGSFLFKSKYQLFVVPCKIEQSLLTDNVSFVIMSEWINTKYFILIKLKKKHIDDITQHSNYSGF